MQSCLLPLASNVACSRLSVSGLGTIEKVAAGRAGSFSPDPARPLPAFTNVPMTESLEQAANVAPPPLKDLLRIVNSPYVRKEIHSYHTRNSHLYRLPLCRTNIKQFSVFYQGP